jgi:predicted metal-dependent hydrolase
MLDTFDKPIEIIRSNRRKSVEIQLTHDFIKVRVPQNLSDESISKLIAKRSHWIRTKLKEQALQPQPKPREFVSGESFPYLGRNYRLKVIKCKQVGVKLIGGYFQVNTPDNKPNTVRQLLEDWFKDHALQRLQDKTERFAKIVGVSPKSVSIKSYKARWGSCSVNGDLTFNWRIIHAPHSIVDYIIVHELCHMIEHNHSERFWKRVESSTPNYQVQRIWLKRNSELLSKQI